MPRAPRPKIDAGEASPRERAAAPSPLCRAPAPPPAPPVVTGAAPGERGFARRARSGSRDAGRIGAAVGYCRRSTDRQEQSIPDQRKAVEAYCRDQGLSILRWYIDDAISGTSAVNRPAFQAMVADAEGRGDFGIIVVYDVKRFGRVDNDEAGYYRHVLRTRGVEVAYATEGFSGGETDDLLRPVKQWQARQESKDLSKVTIRGLLTKAQTGAWLGGVPPHGYDLRYENDRPPQGAFLFILRHMPDGSKQMLNERGKLVRTLARGESIQVSKRDRARLLPGDPERVETVRRIFSLYVDEGRGLKAVADALNRAGVPTPRGPAWSHIYGGQWRDSTVRAILVNPLYAGDMVWNRRTDARFHMIVGGEGGDGADSRAVERKHVHGARLVPNDEADWIIIRDTHEGLVSRKVFEKAKAMRLARPVSASQIGQPKAIAAAAGVVGGWTGARSRFILSGLVYCGLCGHRYQGVTRQKGTPRRDGTKVRTYSYACGGYIAKGTTVCQFNPVGQEALEGAVIDAVLKFYGRYEGKSGRERLVAEVQKALGIEARDLAEARRRLEAERGRVEATIASLLDNLTPGTRDLAEGRLVELRHERKRLDGRREELDRLVTEQAQVQDTAHDLARFFGGLGFTLRHGLPAERLTALRRCIARIEIDKAAGTAPIHLHTLPALGLARVEQRVPIALPARPDSHRLAR